MHQAVELDLPEGGKGFCGLMHSCLSQLEEEVEVTIVSDRKTKFADSPGIHLPDF